jgi:hypothetical protein
MFYIESKRVKAKSVNVNEMDSNWKEVSKDDLDETKKPENPKT